MTFPYPLEELKDYNLYLYKRNYIGFNLTCLGERELNEESINFLKKHENAIFVLDISTVFILINQPWNFFLYLGSVSTRTWSNYVAGHTLSPVIIILLSISFSLTLGPMNSIFKCTEVPIVEKLNQYEKLEPTLIIVSFGLYMFMIVINLISMIIDCEIFKKISDCCKKWEEQRDLALLGFTKENPQTELKTY